MDIRKTLGLKRDEYQHKLNAEMSEWDAQIERERAERKRAAAQEEIDDDDEDYREYRARRQDADRKLSDLRNASEDKWEDMKTGVEKSWADVKNAFNKIGNRIRH